MTNITRSISRRPASRRARTAHGAACCWQPVHSPCSRSQSVSARGASRRASATCTLPPSIAAPSCRRSASPKSRRRTRCGRCGCPPTRSAFAAANIFARASGYVETRKVDIGDKVKAGDLLATIVAPRTRPPDLTGGGDAGQAQGRRAAGRRQPRSGPGHVALATIHWSRSAGCPQQQRARSTCRRSGPTRR